MNTHLRAFRDALSEEARRLGRGLADAQLDAMCRHYNLLRKWNARARLAGTIEPARAAVELFADCLVADRFIDTLPPAGANGMIDIGSGGGLPGVPLKILRPKYQLTIIEANANKVAYIKTLLGELGLADADAVRGRAETLGHRGDLRERFDLAFCRAVGQPVVACEFAIPFLKIGGVFIAQMIDPHSGGPATDTPGGEPLDRLRVSAARLGATVGQKTSYTLSGVPVGRLLIAVKKESPTPAEFPRDPRTIKKKPLA